jgi:hypothetical protein
MAERLTLRGLLEVLSYSGLLTAFGFSLLGVLAYAMAQPIANGLTGTAGLMTMVSVAFYRLSNHPEG